MAATAEDLAQSVVAIGLMSDTELQTFWNGLSSSERPADGEALLRLLVKREALTSFQARQVLAGRGSALIYNQYVVLDQLGAGGMGQVFRARHRKMNRIVALKLLPTKFSKNSAAIRRFQREVEAAAKLTHANIVRAYDADESRGVHYLVMEYVAGRDLSAVAAERGALPIEDAVDYVLQTARGLAYAHSQGVIHRDIKPANLLLDRAGTVKILDMGLARLEEFASDGRTSDELTGGGQVMGTIDYMAPEQSSDAHQADARSDLYSLGCTFYRLLTGQPVYNADSTVKKILAHLDAPVPSLSAQRQDVPAELDRIFRKLIAKQPAERYQEANDLIQDLESWRDGGIISDPQTWAANSTFLGPPPGAAPSLGLPVAVAAAVNLPAAVRSPAGAVSARSPHAAGAERTVGALQPEVLTALPSAVPVRAVPIYTTPLQPQGRGGFKRRLPLTLIAAAGGALVAFAGLWIVVRNRDGEEVARLQVPEGGRAEVVDVGEPPAVPVARSAWRPGETLAAAPTATSPVAPAGSTETVKSTDAFALPPPATGASAADATGSVVANNYALQFDGVDDVVSVTQFGELQPAVLTIEAWVVAGPTTANYNDAVNWGASRALRRFSSKFAALMDLRDGSNPRVLQSADQAVTGTRQHVAVVWSANRQAFYVDGRLSREQSLAEPQPTRGYHDRLTIGAQSSAAAGARPLAGSWIGILDEVRISSAARYERDFTPQQRFEPDAETLALYHFDEGAGDVLKDASGHGHDGQIVGARWVRGGGAPAPVGPAAAMSSRSSVPTASHQELLPRTPLPSGPPGELKSIPLSGAPKALVVGIDGAHAGAVTSDDRIVWYELASSRPVWERSLATSCGGVAASPDGRWLAVVGRSRSEPQQGLLQLLTVADGALGKSAPLTAAAQAAAFSADGRRLAVGLDSGKIQLFDAVTLQPQRLLAGHPKAVLGLAFSPDGRRLASGSRGSSGSAEFKAVPVPDDERLKLWDVDTGAAVDLFQNLNRANHRSLDFSNDGKWLLVGMDNSAVTLWDAETGKKTAWFTNPRGKASPQARLLPSGRHALLAGTTLHVIELPSLRIVHEFGEPGSMMNLAVTPDGRFALTSRSPENTLRVWRLPAEAAANETEMHAVAIANDPPAPQAKHDNSLTVSTSTTSSEAATASMPAATQPSATPAATMVAAVTPPAAPIPRPTALPANPRAGSLAGVELYSEITLMAGVSLPTAIGAFSQDELPPGTRLTFKAPPKYFQADVVNLEVVDGIINVPLGVAPDTPPGSYIADVTLTRITSRIDGKISLSVEPYEPYRAIATCVRLQVPPNQPTLIDVGKGYSFHVKPVNQSLQPLPIPPNPDANDTNILKRFPIGYTAAWIERLDGDQRIPEFDETPTTVRRGNLYSVAADVIGDDAKLPPGPLKSSSVAYSVISNLAPGKYRILFEFYPQPGGTIDLSAPPAAEFKTIEFRVSP